tara:strand:+ start:1117 stop:1320 length:204 start_codon:yes stop_codon:yes gene_type:complete
MYWAQEMIPVGNDLFVIKRKFKQEQFQKVMNHFGAKVVCEHYHCETVLKGKDGFFYLCDKVDDAQII